MEGLTADLREQEMNGIEIDELQSKARFAGGVLEEKIY